MVTVRTGSVVIQKFIPSKEMEGQTRYRSNKSDFRGTDGRDVAGNGGERAEHSE